MCGRDSEAAPTTQREILIVEDDGDLQDALSEILRDEGYNVSCASHGREALDHLRGGAARPCVILLDLTMPVMNGWQFRDEQRQDPQLSDLPVVVLSAGANLAEQVSSLGIREYIKKPIPLPQLLSVVRRYCGEPELSSESPA